MRRAARLLGLMGVVVLAMAAGSLSGWAAAGVPVPTANSAGAGGHTASTATSTITSSNVVSEPSSRSSGSAPAGTTGDASGPPPAMGAVGFGGGFPSFQTAAPYLSLQAQFVGLQVKTGLTAVGPYFGFELRGYPPAPLPVPLFVALGGGIYGGETTYFATLGAHVPLSLHARLDLEGGAANVPLLDKRTWAPYVSLGVSYAFPFTPTHGGGEVHAAAPLTIGGSAAVVCEQDQPPDKGLLLDAFHRTLTGFLDSARATYGSVYTDLHYSYDITSVSISGDSGRVSIHYSGSVRTIATGRTESASCSASASYRWTGCSWAQRRVDY